MAERQKQGFALEEMCSSYMPYLCLSDDYTSEDDAIYILPNGLEIDVSIKSSTPSGEICLGAMSRIIRSSNPLLLIYGIHRRKVFLSISAYILPNGWHTIFSSSSDIIDECDSFESYMHGISGTDYFGNEYDTGRFHSHGYDSDWRLNMKRFKQDYNESINDNDFVYPRPKRDHKHQSRLQAAIPSNRKNCLVPFLIVSNEKPYDMDEWEIFANSIDNALDDFIRR